MSRRGRDAFAALAPIDVYGPRLVHAGRRRPLRYAVIALSHGGRGGFVWPTIGFAVGGQRRRMGRVETAIATAAVVASALGISTSLARTFARPRPCERGADPLVPCPEGGSFPSDQTAAAFAAAELIGSCAVEARRPLLATATALAAARVAAGVHYPSDVVAGGALGVAIGRLATRLLGRRAAGRRSPDR